MNYNVISQELKNEAATQRKKILNKLWERPCMMNHNLHSKQFSYKISESGEDIS